MHGKFREKSRRNRREFKVFDGKFQTKICVVYQIRNACKHVVWKDRKQFTDDMKHIYNASNKQAAEAALNDFAQKWESKYAYAIKSWRNN